MGRRWRVVHAVDVGVGPDAACPGTIDVAGDDVTRRIVDAGAVLPEITLPAPVPGVAVNPPIVLPVAPMSIAMPVDVADRRRAGNVGADEVALRPCCRSCPSR